MYQGKVFQTIETHTFGQPTRVIDGGLLPLPGQTMAEKRDFLAAHYDYIRTALIQEPRGHRDMFGALLTQPANPDADYGVIFMDNSNYLNMCGHAVIGVATALITCGWVEAVHPRTKIVLDTPAGLIESYVNIEKGGSVSSVTFKNVPGFLHYRDVEIEAPGVGKLCVDIAFGGNYLAFVPAKVLGFPVNIHDSRKFKFFGKLIKDAINQQLTIRHPNKEFIHQVDIVSFYSDATVAGAAFKIVNIYSESQADRSPGGTGTTAWVARLFGRGELQLNEEIFIEGFVGGTFGGKAVEEVKIGEVDGVVVEVTGKAYLMGKQDIILSPDDPFCHGFIIE